MIAFHTWYFRWTFEDLIEFVGLVLPLKLQIVTDPRTSLKTTGDQKDDDDGYSKWVFSNGMWRFTWCCDWATWQQVFEVSGCPWAWADCVGLCTPVWESLQGPGFRWNSNFLKIKLSKHMRDRPRLLRRSGLGNLGHAVGWTRCISNILNTATFLIGQINYQNKWRNWFG